VSNSRTATFIIPLQGKVFRLVFPFAGSCNKSSSSTGSISSSAGSYSYGINPPLVVGKAESLFDKPPYFESRSIEINEDLELEIVESRIAGSLGGRSRWLESRVRREEAADSFSSEARR
jgi:hypothetical protein